MRGGEVFAFLALCAVVGLVLSPLARAWARRIERSARSPEADAELGDLQQRVAELEMSQQRMLELEERLDFAERILNQRAALDLPEHRTPT